MAVKSAQVLTQMTTRNFTGGGLRQLVGRTDNINTFIWRLSGNLGDSTSWSLRTCMELRLTSQLSWISNMSQTQKGPLPSISEALLDFKTTATRKTDEWV